MNLVADISRATSAAIELTFLVITLGTSRERTPLVRVQAPPRIPQETKESSRNPFKIFSSKRTFIRTECVACLDELEPKQFVVKTSCHSFCNGCFVELIVVSIEGAGEQWPPTCCNTRIPSRTIRRHIPSALWEQLSEKAEEFNTPPIHRIYCSTPDCGMWIPPKQRDHKRKTARCKNGHIMCVESERVLKGPWRGKKETQKEQKRRKAQVESQATDALAKQEGWKRCPCGVLIELISGCNVIQCLCGKVFCFSCSKKIKRCWCPRRW
ncbi:hypothetical protein QBC35DRAFT_202351 [Podospora australis]|uniref:RING-type domain-containing protein n=1 Tax=Podospora australis TaxID=1536484 RepID=A0AAN6X2F2_9PEZI|nr:hypothetical protein QBC35DRAFT_202351 [Podospora australis]